MQQVQNKYPSVDFERFEPANKSNTSFNVTLKAKSGESGSKNSVSGRRMPKAGWDAHRVFLSAFFEACPQAKVKTVLAVYDGQEDFLNKFRDTAHKNIGSIIYPCTAISCDNK